MQHPSYVDPNWHRADDSSTKVRMERGDEARLRKQENRTNMLACHFLDVHHGQQGHPSRLPSGSLHSALTGPGLAARRLYRYEKMAGYLCQLQPLSRLSLVGPEPSIRHCETLLDDGRAAVSLRRELSARRAQRSGKPGATPLPEAIRRLCGAQFPPPVLREVRGRDCGSGAPDTGYGSAFDTLAGSRDLPLRASAGPPERLQRFFYARTCPHPPWRLRIFLSCTPNMVPISST